MLINLVLTSVGTFKNKDETKMNDYYSFDGTENVFQNKKTFGGDYFSMGV